MNHKKKNNMLESRGFAHGAWVYGLAAETEKGTYIIPNYREKPLNWKFVLVKKKSHGYFTGHTDFEGNDIYQGDVVRSLIGGQYIEICFGEYEAYCPGDHTFEPNIGFYAVSEGYPDMPISYLEDYAVRVGNIFENPELRQTRLKDLKRDVGKHLELWGCGF